MRGTRVNETSCPSCPNVPYDNNYAFISDGPVAFQLADITINASAGLNFVTDAQTSGGNDDISLNINASTDTLLTE